MAGLKRCSDRHLWLRAVCPWLHGGMSLRILAAASLSFLVLLLLLGPSTSSPGTSHPRRASRLPSDGAWSMCCLRLRGGISKSALLNNYNPEAESWSESRQLEEIEREAQARAEKAVLGPQDYTDDGVVLEGKPAEREKRRVRLDPTRRMNVNALVKASENANLDSARLGDDDDDELLDQLVQEKLAQMEAELENSDSDSDRFKIPNNFPVPMCHQDAFEQHKLKKRFNDGTMEEEEFFRLLQAEARDAGEKIGPEEDIPGPPLQGRLQTPIDDIYPPKGLLAARIMQLIRTHVRNCRDPECEEVHGGDADWFEERIYNGGMTYWEMLETWRMWAPDQKAGITLKNGHEPWEERFVGNEWIPDESVVLSSRFPACTPSANLYPSFLLPGIVIEPPSRNVLSPPNPHPLPSTPPRGVEPRPETRERPLSWPFLWASRCRNFFGRRSTMSPGAR